MDNLNYSRKEIRLPIFVYGTLMIKKGVTQNQNLDQNLVEGSLKGSLKGYELRNALEFPIAYPNPSSTIFGELLWLDLQSYDETLAMLDDYEGTDFKRIKVTALAEKEQCPVISWVYIHNEASPNPVNNLPIIPNGLWEAR